MPARDPRALVREYHDQTKHHFNRFARSLGYLDWETQPNPFRTFAGAPRVDLVQPLLVARESGTGPGAWVGVRFDDLFAPASAPRLEPGLGAVSVFLRFSLGLSAWKQAGPSRWALRVNPSSGNLHPTEGYVVLGTGIADGPAGVFHYAPDTHTLERRCAIGADAWSAAAVDLPPGAFLAALSSIHWREAWKYGERAFRYCQHDTGHAIAAMRYAAALMGWNLRLVAGWSSASLAALMGLDREDDFAGAEPEEPACLAVVYPVSSPDADDDERRARALRRDLPVPRFAGGGSCTDLAGAARAGAWTGRANRLSPDLVQWDWIDAAAEATRAVTETGAGGGEPAAAVVEQAFRPARVDRPYPAAAPSAVSLLLQRRSAQSMDGESAIDLDRFLFMMRRLLPESGPPFDAFGWEPRVHLVLFVHRVVGLEPGLYALVRARAALASLRECCQSDFAWVRPEGAPEDLPLYLLAPVDCRRIARQLSCAQDIAADGFFSLGMLAEFEPALDAHGAAFYRQLFWETGAIGQALYLEAEAAGARGTGIGCFFDDGVHDLLGIKDHRVQSLYHFTVGIPVDDPCLTTSPGYPWENK